MGEREVNSGLVPAHQTSVGSQAFLLALLFAHPGRMGGQQVFSLSMLNDSQIAEVILLRSLDAERALGPHPHHRLKHIQRAHILQL